MYHAAVGVFVWRTVLVRHLIQVIKILHTCIQVKLRTSFAVQKYDTVYGLQTTIGNFEIEISNITASQILSWDMHASLWYEYK